MLTIWKFNIHCMDNQIVMVPRGAKILHIGCQGMKLYLWAEVDSEESPEPRTIIVVGTGNPIPVLPRKEYRDVSKPGERPRFEIISGGSGVPAENRYIGTVEYTSTYALLIPHVYEVLD